ncbi:Uncharacterized protein Rs2_11480 [Raphanus sativus]|nr:Uncharacterized protein Rs2_11480 [Raphanus sativus]
MEAEAKRAYASIWVDNDGFIAEGPNKNVAFVVNGGKELVMPRKRRSYSQPKALLDLLLEDMSSGPPSVRALDQMKIEVKQARIVKPAEETPVDSLWLSNLDLIQVRFHMGILYFYNPCSSSNIPNTPSLIDALSKVLVLFYPAAGGYKG